MNEGFIKLHRKLLENPIASNPALIGFFCFLLLLASHTDHEFYLGNVKIQQKKGQMIVSQMKLAKDFSVSRGTIHNRLHILMREHIIDIKAQSKYTVVTINNREKYQSRGHQNDNRIATEGQQNSNRVTSDGHNQEGIRKNKKEKNDKKENTFIEILSSTKDQKIEEEKNQPLPEINNLIELIKGEAFNLGLAYNKDTERNFAKHILTAKEYGNFCESIGMSRQDTAIMIMKLSVKINFFKGPASGPKKIYQNYAEIYNKGKQEMKENSVADLSGFLPSEK